MSKRFLFAIAMALAATAPVLADGGKSLRREVLENGAVVIVKEDHNMPIVTLQAWFPVGSITEGENLGQGLSHYVEHMIFKGTAKQPPGDFARAVKAAGGDLNAYTSFDRTVFHCIVRSGHFDNMLESFGDVIQNSKMDPAEATKEQQVIVNELKMYLDDPNRIIQYAYNETALRVHPARHPIGGYLDQFLKLKPEDVGTYFRHRYAPNNMIFVCVGDVDGAAAMSAIRKTFGGWERKALPPMVLPGEPPQRGVRREQRFYPVVNGLSSGARLKIGWPTVDGCDDDAPALDVAALVMGYGDASRLAKSLRNEKRLMQSVSAHSDTPGYRGDFSIAGSLDPAKLEAAEKEILVQVEQLKSELVTEAELARVLAAITAFDVTSKQDIMKQADSLASGEMYHGNPEFDDEYLERLKAVKPEEIRRVAQKYLVPATMTVASVVPRAAEGIEAPPVGTAKAEFEPHVEEFTLDNGMRVVVRRNPNTPSFAFTMAFLEGSRLEPADKPGTANLSCEMLLRGTKTRSGAQINEEIAATGGSFKVQGGRNTLFLNAEMLTKDFGKALDLAADVLMNPAFDPTELDKARESVKFQIDRMRRDAGGATAIRFHKAMYGDHPYGRVPLGTPESIAAITPDDLRVIHARFIHPGNCVLAVVGDLDAAMVRLKLEKSFSGFRKLEEPLPGVKPPAVLDRGATDDVTDPTKNMGVAYIGFPTVTMKEQDRWALQVLEKILGGMGGRLWDQVREKRNLAYNVWASNVTMLDRGYFQLGVMAQGECVDPALDVIKAEIKRICDEPATPGELESAKNGVIGEMLIDLQKNSSQSQRLALDTLYGLGPRDVFGAPRKVELLTAADIQSVAKKYLDPKLAIITITRPGK